MSTNLKNIQMYTNKFFLLFVFTLLSYSYASAQHINELTVDGQNIECSGDQYAVSNEVVVTTDNILHINTAAANIAGTAIHWKIQADYNEDGFFDGSGETLALINTGSSASLITDITLSGEYLQAISIRDVAFRIMVSNSNDFSLSHAKKASIEFKISGPIKVGNSAEANNKCLPSNSNSINDFYIKNVTGQTIELAEIKLNSKALNFPSTIEISGGVSLLADEIRPFDVLFDQDFGTFGTSSFDLSLSFDWSYTNGNPQTYTSTKEYVVCKKAKFSEPGLGISPLIAATPNPFHQVTSINYTVEKAGVANIVIYNSFGQKVKTILTNTLQEVGLQKIELNGADLNPGLYFIQIKVEDDIQIKQILKQK